MSGPPQRRQGDRTDSASSRVNIAASDESPRRSSIRFQLSGEDWTALGLFALTLLLILASRWISPSFGTWNQARAILVLSSFVMVVGFGQQMVILIGGVDLSVSSVMTLGGILTFSWVGGSAAASLWGVPAVLLLTGLLGAMNGIGVALLRIPPFIMTLATGIITYSTVLGITHGSPRGEASSVLSALFTNNVLGIPLVLYLMAAITVFGSVLQRRTAFGRRLYALGTSPRAAYIAGLPVQAVTILCYAMSGAAAGLAGVLMVGFAGGATLTMGQSFLFPSIAAVVIGGTSILGGRGHYPGVVGGAVLLTTFSTIISALGIVEAWRIVIYGSVILLAMLLLREELYLWVKRFHAALAPARVVGITTEVE
jgi:ribose transport system permease protein